MKKTVHGRPAIPFDFILEALASIDITLRPMFGCFAIYVGEKLVLILRDRKDHPADNGVWLAIPHEHHEELKKFFPGMRSVRLLGSRTTVWQNLPKSSEDFEESALRACEMIIKRDPRIGKIPRKKTKKPTVRKR